MSNYAYACCCDANPPGGTCDATCFASSYVITQLSGSFHYESTGGISKECLCPIGIGEEVGMEYFVDASFTLPQSTTLTRRGSSGNCCYEARGELQVTCDLRMVERNYCCVDETYVTQDTAYSRTVTVPFCLTFRCLANNLQPCARTISGAAKWVVQLQICDFWMVTSHDFLAEDATPGCQPNATLARGIVCGGATLNHLAKLEAPDRIVFTETGDYLSALTAISCNPSGSYQPGCDGDPSDDTCMPKVMSNTFFNGPFPMFTVPEFSEQDAPADCSLACFAAGMFASVYDAFLTSPVQPTGPCFSTENQWTAYGSCERSAILNGGFQWQAV